VPIVPNLLERSLLRLNLIPGPAQDLLGTVMFRAAGVAVQLGLFEILADAPSTAAELARRVDASEEGLRLLLELLAAGGYVAETNGRFRDTPMVRRWLLQRAPGAMTDFLTLWQGVAFDLWDNLEASVRAGRPALPMHEWLAQRPEGWPLFNAAMRAAAMQGADEVARRTPLPATARRLLDVGGSHGLYSLAFCRRHPELSATILDAPEALPSAQQTIAAQGMAARMTTRLGDMTRDDFGAGWDVILLFNVLHYFGAEQNLALLRKASTALSPGGRVVVLDQFADFAPLPAAGTFVKALSLMYFMSLGGRVYRFDEIAGWLQAAGLQPPRRIGLRRSPGQYLLIAARG
jgi:SAM-dependent methyltransferase